MFWGRVIAVLYVGGFVYKGYNVCGDFGVGMGVVLLGGLSYGVRGMVIVVSGDRVKGRRRLCDRVRGVIILVMVVGVGVINVKVV